MPIGVSVELPTSSKDARVAVRMRPAEAAQAAEEMIRLPGDPGQ
jgi:hypothetical protein